ncbi:MAG: DUF4349 domain-containing protein [Clostridiales Family XIII bacterium]|jgi:hypothetical protein|nr:DUF4349 domain-containing protein [Clostridiales Family XIII bacterium]
MKKIIFAALSALLVVAALTSCSSGGYNSGTSSSGGSGSDGYADSIPPTAAQSKDLLGTRSYESYDMVAEEEAPMPEQGTETIPGTDLSGAASLSEKIIYTADANIETTEFDAALEKTAAMIEKFGAFIESSSVNGLGYADAYYGGAGYRSANYRIRVPVKNFSAMTGSFPDLGNVIWQSSNAENITAQFIDTESRLNTYRTEESRLFLMLEQSTKIEDMILLEARLSEVRYEIERLTSSLRNWQNQVDYSTVNLNFTEVEKLTEQFALKRSYGQEIGDGLKASLRGVGAFFKSFLKIVIIALPVLVVLAVVVAVVFIVVKRAGTFRRKRAKNDGAEKDVSKDVSK